MRFSLLGGVSATAGGVDVPLGRRRERLLLGILLLEANRVVPADRLIDLLWDDAEASRRAMLRVAVARLRAVLAPYDVVVSGTAAGYRVDIDADRVDAHRFAAALASARDITDPARRADALGHALAGWTGEPLAGLAGDRLRQRVTRTLLEQRITAVEWWAEAALLAGRPADVDSELAAATAEHPFRERLVALHMAALVALDRPTDALAVYRDLCDRLDTELGTRPGSPVRDLYVRILKGDVPGRATARGHRTLPRELRGFVGRDDELKALDDLMRADGPAPLVVISGPGGVGKTTLATQWAHAATDLFPDGQLYLDLGGFSGGTPRAVGDSVTRLLIALGVPVASIPADVSSALALYQRRLSGRRTLVVLDNAADAGQTRPLIPADRGGGVIVTSRSSLAGLAVTDGARLLHLEPMRRTESLAVLGEMVGAERLDREHAAADALADLCGDLPLAIRIAGASLAAAPRQSLASYRDRLRSGRLDALVVAGDEETGVRATIRHSYEMLDPTERRALRLVTLGRGDGLDRAATAALLGRSRAVTDRTIDRLVDAHLVRPVDDAWYVLHDLIAEFAREQLDPAAPDAARARDRLLGYYIATADRAVAACLPAQAGQLPREPRPDHVEPTAFDDAATAQAWLERHAANLTSEAVAAAADGPHRAAVHLADSVFGYLLAHAHAVRLLAVAEAGVAGATADGDPRLLSRALRALGSAYLHGSGDYPAADAATRRAADLARSLGDLEGTAGSLILLSSAARESGRLDDARRHGRDALDAARASGVPLLRANALFLLGAIGLDRAEWDDARRYATEAGEQYAAASSRHGVAHARLIESEALLERGDADAARAHAERALAEARADGFAAVELLALAQLAVVADEQGRHRDGLAVVEDAIRMARASGNPAALAHCLVYRADLRRHLGQLDAAETDYRDALDTAEAVAQVHAVIRAQLGLAQLSLARSDRPAACHLADRAYDAADAHGLIALRGRVDRFRAALARA